MADLITAGERRELRSVVRTQMKALRAEVKQRELNLDAEIEQRLVEKFREDDKRRKQLEVKLQKLTDQCNEKLQKLLEEYDALSGEAAYAARSSRFNTPYIYGKTEKQADLRRALQAGMKAEIRKAATAIDRQEADLLRDLAVDALRTESARAFLKTILSVKQLVPSEKILEIEAQYEGKTG
jgi:hypothetical protein